MIEGIMGRARSVARIMGGGVASIMGGEWLV